jgi:hypothetical protein
VEYGGGSCCVSSRKDAFNQAHSTISTVPMLLDDASLQVRYVFTLELRQSMPTAVLRRGHGTLFEILIGRGRPWCGRDRLRVKS